MPAWPRQRLLPHRPSGPCPGPKTVFLTSQWVPGVLKRSHIPPCMFPLLKARGSRWPPRPFLMLSVLVSSLLHSHKPPGCSLDTSTSGPLHLLLLLPGMLFLGSHRVSPHLIRSLFTGHLPSCNWQAAAPPTVFCTPPDTSHHHRATRMLVP